jgi:hypothetical protein
LIKALSFDVLCLAAVCTPPPFPLVSAAQALRRGLCVLWHGGVGGAPSSACAPGRRPLLVQASRTALPGPRSLLSNACTRLLARHTRTTARAFLRTSCGPVDPAWLRKPPLPRAPSSAEKHAAPTRAVVSHADALALPAPVARRDTHAPCNGSLRTCGQGLRVVAWVHGTFTSPPCPCSRWRALRAGCPGVGGVPSAGAGRGGRPRRLRGAGRATRACGAAASLARTVSSG